MNPGVINLTMPTKQQLEDELNEMLDTSFEWSRMTKDELELLVELVDEGALMEPMAKHIASEKGKEKVEETVEDWTPGQFISKVM
jgi:hypothetical protein